MKKFISSKNPNGGFVAPIQSNGQWALIEIKSNKQISEALVVYTGKDILANDVFKRIIDAGIKIESVDSLLGKIEELLIYLKSVKIGKSIGITNNEFYEI